MKKMLAAAGIAFAMSASMPPAIASPAGQDGKSTSLTDEQLSLVVGMASYAIAPNITYRTVDGWEGKLDVFAQRGARPHTPTLIYFHGGGWQTGTKEERMTLFFPYLAMGWNVVNVEYRLARQALAPAAARDARCALWWVLRNANTVLETSSGPVPLKIDPDRIVTSGTSAGGHLALLTAFATPESGLDEGCEHARSMDAKGGKPAVLKVAAVIDWFGISDVADLANDPKTAKLNSAWVGTGPRAREIAVQVSPITYVRRGVPPVISIHGDSDPGVPIGQKRAFHQALARAGVVHELIEVKGGGHGTFPGNAYFDGYRRIEAFLRANGILVE